MVSLKKIRTKVPQSAFLKKSVQNGFLKKIRTCIDKSVRVGILLLAKNKKCIYVIPILQH